MKKLFTLAIALAAGLSAAQAQTNIPPVNLLHQQTISWLLSRQKEQSAQKTTGLQQRIIARHTDYYQAANFAYMDSARYVYYSNARGSVFDFYGMGFESYDFIDYLAGAGFTQVSHIAADTVTKWENDLSNANGYFITDREKITYTAAGSRNTAIVFHDPYVDFGKAQQIFYTYDAQGRPATILVQHDSSSNPVWKDFLRSFYSYNAQGNILTDSTEQYNLQTGLWSNYMVKNYTYDASGTDPLQIDYHSSVSGNRMLQNTFYPDHRLKTTQCLLPATSGPGMIPYSTDSFGYSGNHGYTYRRSDRYDTAQQQWPFSLITRHVNAQDLPDTVWAWNWSPNTNPQWQPTSKAVYTYNAYDNPEEAVVYSYYNNPSAPDSRYRFYYEAFFPAAVPAVPAVMQDIQLYPNPAGSILNIRWRSAGTRTPVSVSVTAMNGQMVYTETRQWAQAVQQLSIGHLQPGMYQLTISGQDGKMLYHGSFVKE